MPNRLKVITIFPPKKQSKKGMHTHMVVI